MNPSRYDQPWRVPTGPRPGRCYTCGTQLHLAEAMILPPGARDEWASVQEARPYCPECFLEEIDLQTFAINLEPYRFDQPWRAKGRERAQSRGFYGQCQTEIVPDEAVCLETSRIRYCWQCFRALYPFTWLESLFEGRMALSEFRRRWPDVFLPIAAPPRPTPTGRRIRLVRDEAPSWAAAKARLLALLRAAASEPVPDPAQVDRALIHFLEQAGHADLAAAWRAGVAEEHFIDDIPF